MFPKRWQWVGLAVAALATGPAVFAQSSSSPAGARITAAGASIPQPPTAHNEQEFSDQRQTWYRKTYLESFQRASKGKPWDTDGQKFVEDAVAELFAPYTGQPVERWKTLADRGSALLKSGCNDCVVRFLTARCRYLFDSNRDNEHSDLQKVLEDADHDPNYRKAFAGVVAIEVRNSAPRSSEFDQKVLELLGKAFEEGAYAGKDDVMFVFQIFTATDFEQSGDRVEKLAGSLTGLPDWAQKTLMGKAEMGKAWRSRGHDWANNVTEDGWAGFKKGMDAAEKLFTDAWKLRPDQPYAPAEMITVTMSSESEPSPALRTWFDRTVSARFDFGDAYGNYENGLMPRWGGSYDEMIAFGFACARTKRFETNVPGRLISTIEGIGREVSKRREVFQLPGLADAILAVDNGYMAEPKRPSSLKLWQYNTLLDGWLCHRWSDAKAALDQLGNEGPTIGILNRLQFFGLGMKNLRGETEVYNSPAKEDYAKARELDLQDKYSEAAPHYDAALKSAAGLKYGSDIITFMKRLNDFKVEFHKDQWTDISPKSVNDDKWDFADNADITVPQPGTLQIAGKGETTLSTCKIMVGENYELQADFEFLSPLDGKHLFAVQLGHGPTSQGITCQLYFDRKSSGSLNILREFYNTSNPKFKVDLQLKNHVQIQCWKGAVNLSVNGYPVLTKFVSKEGTPSAHFGSIGFGGYRLTRDEGYRLTNIRIRPLKSEPVTEDLDK